MVYEIQNETEFKTAINTTKLVAFDFFADWCGPCKMIAPFFESLSVNNPTVDFYKINADNDALENVCQDYKIQSLPSFLFFKDNKYIGRIEGANRDRLEKIVLEFK